MHIELNNIDLSCMAGPSSRMIGNLAKLAEPFGLGDEFLRAGSVLEAAELMFETIPSPHLEYMTKFVPPTIADRAAESASSVQRSLVNMAGMNIIGSGNRRSAGCPWAFIMSRGVVSVDCIIERVTKTYYECEKIGPGSDEWTIWEGCISEWNRMHTGNWTSAIDLESALSSSVSTIVDVQAKYGKVPRALSARLDFFAWEVELKKC